MGPTPRPDVTPKVVVGSRAEAKAVRAAAQNAQREAIVAAKVAEKTARARARAKQSHAGSTTAVGGVVRWGTFDAVAVSAALLVLIAAKEAALGSPLMIAMPHAGQIAGRALVLGLFYALLAGVLTGLASRHGLSLASAFDLRSRAVSATRVAGSAVLVVGLLFVTRASALVWGVLARAVGWAAPGGGDLTAVFGAGGVGLAFTIAVVVLVGPLVEELAFRGLFLPALLERFGLWKSLALSSAVFAMSHASAWTLVPTFVLGLACGWLVARRGSLWSAIALHSLYNAVIVAAAFWVAA